MTISTGQRHARELAMDALDLRMLALRDKGLTFAEIGKLVGMRKNKAAERVAAIRRDLAASERRPSSMGWGL